MMKLDFPESDWKLFRQLRELALERFCERVLAEIGSVAADVAKSHHDRYLAVYKLIHERNDELADAFNNPRRSAMLQQLALIRSLRLLTDDEFARFRPETRDTVAIWLGEP